VLWIRKLEWNNGNPSLTYQNNYFTANPFIKVVSEAENLTKLIEACCHALA
jgi:hypothetical protein